MTTVVSTILSTRFNHPLYGDEVINLSITDLLDTQMTGQLTVNALRAVHPLAVEGVPFAFTEDLRLFVVTTARHSLSSHLITLPRMRLDVAGAPSRTGAQQSIRLSGSWRSISECEYEEAVEVLTRRFPTFDATIGRFAQYQQMSLAIYRLHADYLLMSDEMMFGAESIGVEVLRLKLPSAVVTPMPAMTVVQVAS
jgi:hypothetical protein